MRGVLFCAAETSDRRHGRKSETFMADRLLVNAFNFDAALAIGRARGMFSARGLDVDVTITPNSTDQMRGLGKGSWQIASTAFDNILGWSGREGSEFIAVAQIAQGITLPVYVRPEIRTWEDLRGKPLAVDAVDTAYALVLRRVLRAHGLEMARGDYTLLPKGTTGFRLESLTQGESFAAIVNPPWDKKADAAGHKRFADHREVLPDYPGGVFAVSRQWAAGSAELLRAFLRAWAEALDYAHEVKNHDETLRILSDADQIDEAAAANRLRQLPRTGVLNLSGLQSVLDLRVQFDLTPKMGNDLRSYYDTEFYRAKDRL
jgi:ABC-type nitrate/sulfonate/bicarbonate transport system substrate-binding protein